ncbi:(2Fe-2S)-binding protein [Collimonas antrihumi]|uniref:(2Fe-2S)-binding protein n=1 Tax=Collimonas antrihumi TaxID=1940615 RepID=UPI001B8D6E06|nr:(2Fe-2S)-binding protein [Collimonas antrihumi]
MTLFTRVAETQREPVAFSLDGRVVTALAGDTILAAVLTQADSLRLSEFSRRPRAGFCLIGACQDCWMRTEDGQPVRACSAEIQSGMRLLSAVPGATDE